MRFGSQFLATNPSSRAIRSAPSPCCVRSTISRTKSARNNRFSAAPAEVGGYRRFRNHASRRISRDGRAKSQSLGGSPVSIHLYVEDADAIFNQTAAAGATVKRPMAGQFYGESSGRNSRSVWIYVVDLNGQGRFVAEEIEKRAAISH